MHFSPTPPLLYRSSTDMCDVKLLEKKKKKNGEQYSPSVNKRANQMSTSKKISTMSEGQWRRGRRRRRGEGVN